jgi:menaquinol-cytochrome c reductase cytochrome b/c subunit
VAKDSGDGGDRDARDHLPVADVRRRARPKANPTTTTYVPRPDWYFFFLFEVLRVIKPPVWTQFATIGVPTVCMVLLFLLPFYDRSPERRIERRPVALTAGMLTIFAMAYLTYSGANAGSINTADAESLPPT